MDKILVPKVFSLNLYSEEADFVLDSKLIQVYEVIQPEDE